MFLISSYKLDDSTPGTKSPRYSSTHHRIQAKKPTSSKRSDRPLLGSKSATVMLRIVIIRSTLRKGLTMLYTIYGDVWSQNEQGVNDTDGVCRTL